MTPEYLLTSLIIILLPGTGVVYTIAYGLGVGWRASMIAAFGCTLGIIPHVAASVTGLAALLHASALAFQAVKYLGVAYLLVMAWGIWRDEGVLQVASTRTSSGAGKIILDGLLLNILNPKLSLFFLAFLPQFVPANTPNASLHMLALAGIFMGLTFVVFLGYGVFAAATRRHVISRPRLQLWLRRSFAGAFAALGLSLAIADR
ncbi:MAG TPA: LysE family translocator [Rhizobium sp.]|nr:LysE family translocator [Rhizobium sp.]